MQQQQEQRQSNCIEHILFAFRFVVENQSCEVGWWRKERRGASEAERKAAKAIKCPDTVRKESNVILRTPGISGVVTRISRSRNPCKSKVPRLAV